MPRLRSRFIRRLLAGAVVSAALLVTSCAGGSSVETGERPDLPRSAESSTSPLPDVAVWDVGAAQWVQFADVLPSSTPVVLWFWAPHCPACAAEASAMKAFAEEQAGVVEVVGIGTQDDAGMAADFVDRHDIPFTMLWDESFESWAPFEIRAQPASVLFSGEGELVEGWMGGLPEQRVLELVGTGDGSA